MRKGTILFAMLMIAAILIWPSPAQAMHISEGVLPVSWAGVWFAVAVPFVMLGLHTIKRRSRTEPHYKAMVALVGAGVFVISCMPIPIPWVGTCSHPCGTGLAALLIGPGATVVVTSVALLLQALFLSHGGLTTMGAGIVSMGVVGAFSAYFVFRGLRLMRVPATVALFAAGVMSDWGTYATTSLQLASALHAGQSMWPMFLAVATAFVPTQLPLGIMEGLMTVVAYRFVMTRRPELLKRPIMTAPAGGVA